MTNLTNNYGRLPFALTKGHDDVYIDSDQGQTFLDMTSGIGVMNLGYSFTAGKNAVKAQFDLLPHMSNLYQNPLQEEVAEKLSYGRIYKAFFCNSGTEANEAAIKLIRLIKPGQKILAFNNGFHGRTFGAMSATMQDKIQAGFAPLVPDFVSCDYNDVDSLLAVLEQENVGAIMLETVQGEGGVLPIHEDLVAALKIAQEHGILLSVDEVQTGVGRTGKLFSFEHFGLQPDIFTCAKGLANGLPVGAMLAKTEFAVNFTPGKHGSTFGGNPLAMASAGAVLSALTENFLADVADKADWFMDLLQEKLADKAQVQAIRGLGFMIGIQILDEKNLSALTEKLRQENLLVLTAGHDVIRLLPPLIMEKPALAHAAEVLEKILGGAL